MLPLDIRIERADSAVATALIAALDQDILARYPGMPTFGIQVTDFEAGGGLFAVAYSGPDPAGCGAFRPYQGAAEIKRMFVAPAFRGRAVGRRILRFLEAQAAQRGFPRAILETGHKQPEAIALYESEGWTRIPEYGNYMGEPISLYFGKALSPAPTPAP